MIKTLYGPFDQIPTQSVPGGDAVIFDPTPKNSPICLRDKNGNFVGYEEPEYNKVGVLHVIGCDPHSVNVYEKNKKFYTE